MILIHNKQLLYPLSGSFTGSFTGSFVGDGSKLTNLPVLAIDSGSLVTTSSFNAFTSSYNQASSSFSANINSLTNATSSYVLNAQTSSMNVLSSSYAATASFVLNAVSASYSATALSASNATSSSYASNLSGGNSNYIPVWATNSTLTSSIVYQSGSSTGLNVNIFDIANPESLLVSGSNINVISGKSNIDNYTQLNIVNKNTGSNASADVVATNDTGNESGNFIDLGINSSTFAGTIGGPNDAYVYTTGSNILIGTTTQGTNANLKLFAGNNATVFPIIVTGSVANMTGSLFGSSSYALSASWAPVSPASLSTLTAATSTNTISNANNAQVWNWDTLTTQTALKIASTSVTTGALLNLVSTSTSSNGEIGLNVNMSGANANASRTSTGIYVSQTKSGTTPNNYGIDVVLSGAGNVTNKIGIRCVTSGGTNWGYNGYGAYISNTTIGSTQTGLYAEANASNLTATIGVYGKCGSAYNNASGYGVIGEAVGVGSSGFQYGVYGSAGNAVASNATANYGVYGISGGSGYATRHGGYFVSSGYAAGGSSNAGTCIGVYTSASGGFIANYGLLVAAGSSGFLTTTPTSTVQINGSFAAGYVAKTANYTLTISDRLVNCTANSFTITLPTAVGITGREYIIKNTGTATTITIATTSAQTIDGLIPSTYNVTTLTPLRVMSDGANWITC